MEKQINCPFCISQNKTPDTKKHLYLNEAKGVYFCQRCGRGGSIGGDLIPFNTGYPGASEGYNSRMLPNKFDNIELAKLYYSADLDSRAYSVWRYCLNRLPAKVVEDKIYWSPDLPYRAIFPIFSRSLMRYYGEIDVWQGRTIEPNVKPKYLTWGKCSRYLYNFEEIKDDWAVLTEGPFSCLSTPNGIASFGKRLSMVQFGLVVSRFNRIYFCYDTDTYKDGKVLKLKEDLARFVEVINVEMPDQQDPNDLGWERMSELLKTYGASV